MRRRSTTQEHLCGRYKASNEATILNIGGPDAVVQAIRNVLQKQQAKGALKLAYLPKAVVAVSTGRDIRLQHLSDKGRSWEDRLRQGLASLSVAEECEDWL
jgi:hypothetical protein